MWRFLDGVSEPIAKKPKTKQEQLETQRLYDKTKRKRNFQDSWKSEYSWLKCDDESVGMVCTVCVKFEESGSFVTGCTNFKIQTIKKHAMSESHCQNTRKSEARSSSTSTASERSLSMLNSAAINKLRILFCNAHYIAKLGRPYSDYVHLCKLDRGNKQLDIGHTYTTDKYCQVFVRSIADTIRQTQKDHISNSKFISVISDGSTDCSSKEAECIMLRSAAAGKVLTQFIGLKHVAKADSEQISRAIIETLNERIGDTWEEKLLAVGCDGASVMLGVKNGVVQKLRQHTNKPKTFSIHCSAHRLELSFKDAMKQVPAKVHQKCEALLLNIYLFYKYSPLNRANLKVSFETLGEKMVIPTRVGGTRWLPHTRRALKHLLMGKTAIIQHLEQIQNPNDSSHRKESAAKAKNYLKLLKDDQVVVWLHFLMDVVSCLSKVSEVIQEKNSTLADVWNELQSAKVIMMRYQDSDGPYLRKVSHDGLLEASRTVTLKSIADAIDKRFACDIHLFKGSSFVSFMNWPEPVDGDLGNYGDDDVLELVETCKTQLQSAGCETDEIENEWIRFKTDICNSKKTLINCLSWEKLWSSESKYPNFFCLVSLLLSLPSSSVDAERGFSRMKIQKNDWRARLGNRNLSDLMLISMEGPDVGEFDPDPAIKLWESDSVRSRRPFFNDNERPKVSPAPVEVVESGANELGGIHLEELQQMAEECDGSEDEGEEDLDRNDIILLQQKSYELLLSLM